MIHKLGFCWCGIAHVSLENEFTLDRTELIPGGNGALIGFSDAFPDKQFLIVPKVDGDA